MSVCVCVCMREKACKCIYAYGNSCHEVLRMSQICFTGNTNPKLDGTHDL